MIIWRTGMDWRQKLQVIQFLGSIDEKRSTTVYIWVSPGDFSLLFIVHPLPAFKSSKFIFIFENIIYVYNLLSISNSNYSHLASNMSPSQLYILVIVFDKPSNSVRASRMCKGSFTGVWKNHQWPHPQIGILLPQKLPTANSFSVKGRPTLCKIRWLF